MHDTLLCCCTIEARNIGTDPATRRVAIVSLAARHAHRHTPSMMDERCDVSWRLLVHASFSLPPRLGDGNDVGTLDFCTQVASCPQRVAVFAIKQNCAASSCSKLPPRGGYITLNESCWACVNLSISSKNQSGGRAAKCLLRHRKLGAGSKPQVIM